MEIYAVERLNFIRASWTGYMEKQIGISIQENFGKKSDKGDKCIKIKPIKKTKLKLKIESVTSG